MSDALVKVTDTEVTTSTLVEHPGGHDGGQFVQEETFGVAEDGTCWYNTGLPDSPTDTFSDEEPGDYVYCQTRENCVTQLEELQTKYRVDLSSLLSKFREPGTLELYFDDQAAYVNDDGDFCYYKDNETWWTGPYWSGRQVPPPEGWSEVLVELG